jgi:hypothetical protein
MMNMKISCLNKKDVVEYVEDMLTSLNNDSPWTMTIRPGISEVCYVTIAIEGLSEDTVKTLGQTYLRQLMNTS